MHKVILFVEDRGHAEFIQALVQRFANQYGASLVIRLGSAKGGHGKVMSRLKEYISQEPNRLKATGLCEQVLLD